MRQLTLLAILTIGACSTNTERSAEAEAVSNYIATAGLEKADRIRLRQQLKFTYVNDYYVIIPSRGGTYLTELERRCTDLRETQFRADMVDERHNRHELQVGFDTVRGCRISGFFAISPEQHQQVISLGAQAGAGSDAPDDT